MKRFDLRILIGLILIGAGIVFLLENLGVISLSGLLWAALLAIGGVLFVSIYIRTQENWWALIPGIILLDLASVILLDYFLPEFSERFGGPFFLGGLAVAFFAVYIAASYNWWAIIPGGVMLTLAGITLIDELVPGRGLDIGGGFFLGLGLTFLLVYLLPNPSGRNTWAIFPAAALLLVGVLVLISAEEIINYIWPSVLILLGIVLILRNLVWKT